MPEPDIRSIVPDPRRLAGQRVLVTGGSSGIGRALVQALAAVGARVFTFGRDADDLRSALDVAPEAPGEVHGITADVARLADIERIFREVDSRFGGLDILINNAAISGPDLDEQSLGSIDYMVRTNLVGYIACSHRAVERMRTGGGGQIVLVGSMSADLREPGGSTYVATKGGIQAFAESLRKSVNESGIRVSLIEPGKVATDMVGMSDAEKEEAIGESKMLRADDVAGAILYVLIQPERCDVVSLQLRPHLQVI